jgi:hypothetical protein
VQAGIESLRYEGAVFDVRVVMVNDGRDWHALFESRLAPPGSSLSNVYQGGTIHVTRELLAAIVGESESRVVEERYEERGAVLKVRARPAALERWKSAL